MIYHALILAMLVCVVGGSLSLLTGLFFVVEARQQRELRVIARFAGVAVCVVALIQFISWAIEFEQAYEGYTSPTSQQEIDQ